MQRRRLPTMGPIFPAAEMEARRHLGESLGRFFLRTFPHHTNPELQFPPEHHANVKKDWILRFLRLIMNVDLRNVERYMADDVDGRLAVLQYVSEPWRDRTDVPGPHPAQTYERLVFVQTEMDRQANIAVLRFKKEERGEVRTREETPAPRLTRRLYQKGWDENEAQREDYDVDDDYNEESPPPETLKMPKRQAATKAPFSVLEISDSSSEESSPPDNIFAPARRIKKEIPQVDDDSPGYSRPPYIPTPSDSQTEAESISVEDTISEGSPRPRILQAPKQQAVPGQHVNSAQGSVPPTDCKGLAALVKKVPGRAVAGGKKPRKQTDNRKLDNSQMAGNSEADVAESENNDDDDLVYLGESRLSYGGKRLPRKLPEAELTDSSEASMAPEQTRLSYGGKRLPRRVPEGEIMGCSEATMATAQPAEGHPCDQETQHVGPVPVHPLTESGFSLSTNIFQSQATIRLSNDPPDKDSIIEELDRLFKSSQEAAITARHIQAEDTITVSNVVQPPNLHLQDIPIGIAASNGPASEQMAENYHCVPEPISPKRQFEQQVTSNARSEPGPPTTPRPTRTRRTPKATATPWILVPQKPKLGAAPQQTPARSPMIKTQYTLVVTATKQPTLVKPSAFYPQQSPRTPKTPPNTARGNLGVRETPVHLAAAVKLTTQPLTNKPPRHEFSPEKYPDTVHPDVPSFTPINRPTARAPAGQKRKMQELHASGAEDVGPKLKIGRRKLSPDEVQTVINAPSTESSLASTESEPDDSIITID